MTVKNLESFLKHLETSQQELLEVMCEADGYVDRFDVTISINGKSIQMPLHADLYGRLVRLFSQEIEDVLVK